MEEVKKRMIAKVDILTEKDAYLMEIRRIATNGAYDYYDISPLVMNIQTEETKQKVFKLRDEFVEFLLNHKKSDNYVNR